MISARWVVLLALLALAVGRVPKGLHVTEAEVKESGRWELSSRAPGSQLVSFAIAVRQQNVGKLLDILRRVSDPHSPVCYGNGS
jgi:hypothetical protein